jgi:NAD(P)-dependent dehydrogenase (short-subunit alcohol dehydrogenase family)
MDLELAGKVAVVTGASKGIGMAVARELAAEGSLVVAGARTVGPLEGLDGIEPFAVDLVDPEGPARLVEHAVEQHGRLDVLVNNVGGVQLRLDGFQNVSDADFQASLELNFFSALRAMRAAVAAMTPRGGGTIVNVTSVNAFFQPDGAVIDYGAAKAALLNVAKALVAGAGAPWHPHRQRLAGPGGDRPVARRRRRGRDDRARDGRRRRQRPRAGDRRHPDRPLHHAG